MFDPQLGLPPQNSYSPHPNNNNNPANVTDDFKAAKDALIASLFELSKAANEASKAAVDFFNVVDAKPQYMAPPLFDQGLLTPQLQHVQSQQGQNSQNPSLPLQQQPVTIATKKKKKIRDPNAPKKPLTSFFLYSNFMRDVIIKERMRGGAEPLSQPQIAQETSRRWKMLPEHEKVGWKDLYEDQKKAYDIELKKYNLFKETGQPYSPPKRDDAILVPNSYKKRPGEEDSKRKDKKKKRKEQ
ncbi:DEKNAAC102541 [Brettanomyces naardenensis]|uniref:DEKNAAC102541 n=1 Tax=Brettanomyces naardenensis TaxID=13370 RepID=A0A448YLG0_BRENA|nr:DEKNAAC102541 [Brettanomyces naardenensis]